MAKMARATRPTTTPAIALRASPALLVPPPPTSTPPEVVLVLVVLTGLGVGVLTPGGLLIPGRVLNPVVLDPVGLLGMFGLPDTVVVVCGVRFVNPGGLVDPAGLVVVVVVGGALGVDSGWSVQWSEAFLDNRPAGYTY